MNQVQIEITFDEVKEELRKEMFQYLLSKFNSPDFKYMSQKTFEELLEKWGLLDLWKEHKKQLSES